MPTSVTSKGQVTVPVEVRRQLGLKTGDLLEFREERGRYYIAPVEHRIEAAFGRVQIAHAVSDADIDAAITASATRGQ